MSEGGRNIPAGNFLLVNGAKPCQLNISLFPLLHLSFGLTIRYLYCERLLREEIFIAVSLGSRLALQI